MAAAQCETLSDCLTSALDMRSPWTMRRMGTAEVGRVDSDTSSQNIESLTQDDHDARVRALGNLARANQEQASGAADTFDGPVQSSGSRGQLRRMGTVVLCGLLLVAVLAVGGFAVIHLTTARSTPTPGRLTINLAAAGAGCPSSLTWSPDGNELAIVAGPADCAHLQGGSARLLLYNVHTGKLVRRLNLTDILQAQRLTPSDQLRWSPDGQWLSIAGIQVLDNNPNDNRVGVLLLSINSGSSRLLTGRLPANTTTGEPSALGVWDARTNASMRQLPLPLPAVTTYSWTPDGAITPFSTTGNPLTNSGRNLFSPWQSGTLHVIVLPDSQGKPTNTTLEIYTAGSGYWSGDSTYVTYTAPLSARIATDASANSSVSTQACLATIAVPFWCQAPVVAPLDTAFASIAAKASSIGSEDSAAGSTTVPDAPIVWRPDGQMIATILPGAGTVLGNPAISISLYPVEGQHPTTTLTLPRTITNDNSTPTPLAWSPSGQRLAGADPLGSTVVIWGPGYLPM